MNFNIDDTLKNIREFNQLIFNKPIQQFACTPKDIVWKKNKARLYRYKAYSRRRKYSTPVLFIYALINKPTVLDLMPGQSMVEYLINEGFDVYLLDWGTPGLEDKDLGFGDLVNDYIHNAVKKILKVSGSDSLTLSGYCMGGTMSCMYAGRYPNPIIKNLVLLAAPISFRSAGISSLWLKHSSYDVDKVVRTFEMIPPDYLDSGLRMLNPVSNYISKYSKLWKLLQNGVDVTSWLAVNKWADDGIPFPGKAYQEWIHELYQEDALYNGEFFLHGNRVNLKNIYCPLLAMAGARDHIVIEPQAKAIVESVSSEDLTYKSFNTGHGGLVFGKVATNETYHYLSQWLSSHSDKAV